MGGTTKSESDFADASALRAAQDRYLELVFRQVPGAVWATDRHLRITYVLGRVPAMRGIHPGEVRGMSVQQFVGTSDPVNPAVAHHHAALAGERQSFRYRFGHRHYEVRIEPLWDNEHRVVGCVGVGIDVTEQYRAERQLERSVSLLEATINAAADGLLVIDKDRQVAAHNRRFLEMWRIPEEVLQRNDDKGLLSYVARQLVDPEGFYQRVQELYDHEEDESYDQVQFKDGRVFERYSRPQRFGDRVVGRVWSFRDVTERQRLLEQATMLADASRLLASLEAEDALESVARLLVPFMGDACVIDLLDDGGPRRVVTVTRDDSLPGLLQLHPTVMNGHPVVRRVGGRWSMAIPLWIRGIVAGALTLVASDGRTYHSGERDIAEELGRRISLSLDNSALYRGAREALRARDELLAVAAHEIRGALTAMRLGIQALGKGNLSPKRMSKVVHILQREDRRLADFVDELLDVSRIKSGRLRLTFEQVDLMQVVQEAAADLRDELARSGSPLSISSDANPVGQWDRFRLGQVVTNLLSNAIKFGRGKPIDVSVTTAGDRARLTVRDRGIGIDPAVHRRIFQPFDRAVAARHYGGLGLGLYIVRSIVDAMGGEIALESTPGEGTTFIVDLPLKRSAT